MKYKVKDLLKADLPPTHADAKLRKEHTLGSIKHNLNHLTGHHDPLLVAIEKLHTVDSKQAQKEAEKADKQIDKKHAKLKSWINKKK